MSETFPAVFISHGSPMMALTGGPARDFLLGLGTDLGTPSAIAIISAHWETTDVTVSTSENHSTIHDFSGFPQALYEMEYPAKGAPELAARMVAQLRGAGFAADQDPGRGLDHGAWIPMLLMYPAATIPVFQISISPDAGPLHHLKLGEALRGFRDDGVLIMASGSMTHNLAELRRGEPDAPAFPWVTEFADWVGQRIGERDTEALLDYRERAPHGVRNHPRDEHFLPLFTAIGAGGGAAGRRVHRSTSLGGLAMDAYAFD